MSRVFKRPMFRKGGEVGGGIMTGISDRENFEEGELASTKIKKAVNYAGGQGIDPVAQLLIQGGLSGMSTAGKGGTIANLASAFQPATETFFKNLGAQSQFKKEVALAGAEADISQALENEKLKLKRLEIEKIQAEGNLDRQNRIDVEIQKGKNNINELQFKLDNPDADPAKKGVIPSLVTEKIDLTETYAESDNLELKKRPDFHARKIVGFERNSSPEILQDFKGVVDYYYGQKGGIERSAPGGEPGDIIYDPKDGEFYIFDNKGNTYKYNPLSSEAEG